MLRHCRDIVIVTLIALVGVCSDSVPPAFGGDPSADSTPQERDNYGRATDTVMPYRSFQKPYLRFFQAVMAFRGSGTGAEPTDRPETARIGVLAPSGAAADADLGRDMIDGIALAIEHANAEGGYQGIPFETVLREDAGLWGSTANAMVALRYQEDVLAVIGSVDGANTHVALRVALKVGLPMINTATTDPTLTETNIPWLLRCMADDRQQGYALAHHIFNTCGISSVAAFRVNDRYGRTGIAEFRDAARRLKHPLQVELRWNPGDWDFSDQLDRIDSTGSQAVVLWGNASDTAAIVREMRRRGMRHRIFGCDRLVSRRFLNEAGDAANGIVAVATFNPTQPNARYSTFSKAFQEQFGREPGTFAAHAYDGANILIASIQSGGLNRVGIRDALCEHKRYDGVTGLIQFDTTFNDVGPVYIATVKDGRYVYQSAEFAKTAQSGTSAAPYRTLTAPHAARLARVSGNEQEPTAVRIGCFLPLDPRGRSAARGLEMALNDDAITHRGTLPIELVVRDSRGTWGDDASALTSLVADENMLALIGSTERRGTHFMETLAARLHIPLITLCGDDPTIHTVPLPWVFSVAPADGVVDEGFAGRFKARYGVGATREAAMGYDAGTLVAVAIRRAPPTRVALRSMLAASQWHSGASGTFRFDPLGRRVDKTAATQGTANERENGIAVTTPNHPGGEGSP